ncbi:hypothetical protein F5148DRAFT_1287608 [Russula earlei]|uniref:Uncharacterized protein n=1 Tax=Russula earlei TaxID=71964 RepID=A0ACC0U335_9AGAM|nr:hypothetical protein F5148DRAFT_1287608 [Russula earlei]
MFVSPAPMPSIISSPSPPVTALPTLEISALPSTSIASATLALPSATPVASGSPTDVLSPPTASGTAQSATATMPSASSIASSATLDPTTLSSPSAIAPASPTAISPLSVMPSIIASTPSASIITPICPTPALQHCRHPPALPQKTKKALNLNTNLATTHHHMLHTTSHIASLSTHVSLPTSAAATCSGDNPATATARQQMPPLHKLPHASSTSMSAAILPPPSPSSPSPPSPMTLTLWHCHPLSPLSRLTVEQSSSRARDELKDKSIDIKDCMSKEEGPKQYQVPERYCYWDC